MQVSADHGRGKEGKDSGSVRHEEEGKGNLSRVGAGIGKDSSHLARDGVGERRIRLFDRAGELR